MNLIPASSHLGDFLAGPKAAGRQRQGPTHIVDRLIDERSALLSRSPLWPLARPLVTRFLHRRQAVEMADAIAEIGGWPALSHVSRQVRLDVAASGLDNIPLAGGFILAANHPTGMADGIAVFDLLRHRRPDLAIFANSDALRVARRFAEVIIPVEWRPERKTGAGSRAMLQATARAFADRRAVVLFPAGRIACRHRGRLTERPWQSSVIALARRYRAPIVPAHIEARNSGLFYLMSRLSDELRDMAVFHELLNKRESRFAITVGRAIAPEDLAGDQDDLAAKLERHCVHDLRDDPGAAFLA